MDTTIFLTVIYISTFFIGFCIGGLVTLRRFRKDFEEYNKIVDAQSELYNSIIKTLNERLEEQDRRF